jgi:hypothetical protein
MLSHQDKRIRQRIQRDGEASTSLAHHELVLFKLSLAIIEDGHR